MEIKCEYCGSIIPEDAEKCPYCGATNNAVKRTTDGTPKTIEELKQWYKARKLPPYEVTRFFIGENYTRPKAFGIYQEGNEFIVYKNKADGQRAIRYKGTDEAYAVNELYLKLKDEILNQKAHNQNRRSSTSANGKNSGPTGFMIFGVIAAIFIVMATLSIFNDLYAGLGYALMLSLFVGVFLTLISMDIIGAAADRGKKFFKKWSDWINNKKHPWTHLLTHYAVCALLVFAVILTPLHNSSKIDYYSYNNHTYVNYHNNWYEYDGSGDYYDINPSDVPDNIDEYQVDKGDKDWDESITEFDDSDYYSDNFSSSDSDYDWSSSDSWDSGSSSWDSDW